HLVGLARRRVVIDRDRHRDRKPRPGWASRQPRRAWPPARPPPRSASAGRSPPDPRPYQRFPPTRRTGRRPAAPPGPTADLVHRDRHDQRTHTSATGPKTPDHAELHGIGYWARPSGTESPADRVGIGRLLPDDREPA